MITDWADVLRKSPIFPYKVEEHNDWKNKRPLGVLVPEYLVWHHDGSPVGPSPGDVQWLIDSYNAKNPSAQIIIGYDGTWHFVGSGIAYHAGATDGIVTNFNSAGTETDQTTGESPSPALIDSVQRGYAAIFKHEGWPATRMRFHKMIARPVGRKPDPDFGTPGSSYDPAVWEREYRQQCNIIQALIDGTGADYDLGGKTSMALYDVVRTPDGTDYLIGQTVISKIETPEAYSLYYDYLKVIDVKHGQARVVPLDVLQWYANKIRAWGGTADVPTT